GDPLVGKIINHSSISEKVGASHLTHYAPTKAAIMMLTKSSALDLAKYGILVNALGTGVVDTNIAIEDVKPEDYEEALKMIPLQRLGLPEDIANLAVFLASNESDYMTGTTVMCDGGYTAQ
ncbi:MAG: SDR family oxidoreductase, partial [Planctomycetes bacterium]|nr:SDR family oxidoreductase [Planctomycetota bacterium]